MLALFGILGLLQITVLSALLLMKNRQSGGILRYFIEIFPVSLIFNYVLVFLLAGLHLYRRPVMLGIMAAEILTILRLYRNTLLQPFGDIISRLQNKLLSELSPLTEFLTEQKENRLSVLKGWVWAVSGCLALSGVLWGPSECRHHLQRMGYTLFLECLCGKMDRRFDPECPWNVSAAVACELVFILSAAGRRSCSIL